MKFPEQIHRLSICDDFNGDFPYPPAGWLPFWEHELGNGDMYGLYWPLGREDQEPLILEMWHDAREMSPEFSSLTSFLEASSAHTDEFDRPDPQESGDTRSPVALVKAANDLKTSGDVEGTIHHLETALDVFPEYTTAMGLLAAQFRRVRNTDQAVIWCLKALRSPQSFGLIQEQLPIWFSRQTAGPESVLSDPLWIRRAELTWKFGGTKENDNYKILQEIIDEYANLNQWDHWFSLSQLYSELMLGETVSFQERYKFQSREWRIHQVDTYRVKMNVDRNASRQFKASQGI